MIFNGKEIEFPAVMQISLFDMIGKLEDRAKGNDEAALYAKELLKEVEKYPALKEGFGIEDLPKYQQSIEKLSKVLFPESLLSNEIKAVTPPFYFEPMYMSTRFQNIIKASGEAFTFEMKDVDEHMFYMYCCLFILGSYFGFPTHGGGPLKIEFFNKDQGLTRTYKLLMNADMSEFIATDKSIRITQEDYEELMDNFGNMEVWKKKFPPNSWIMRGVNVVNLVDITLDQSIADITSNLLVKTPDTFNKIQQGLRTLLNNARIDFGLLTLDGGSLTTMGKEDITSILLNQGESLGCDEALCDMTYGQLIQRKEPLVIPDVDKYHHQNKTGFSTKLTKSKYKSYIIVPLVFEDELFGFIELGANNKYELNFSILPILDEVLPIMVDANKRFKDEAQNRIEAIIQQECTTIHQSVKWKFEEEAHKFMNSQYRNEQPVFRDLIFNELYPLYGQMDIKSSSEKRNDAVSADLLKQIDGVRKVLKAVLKETKMPIYEELIFRLEAYKSELKKGLSAGSEHQILGFLDTEIYPVFEYISTNFPELKKHVEKYNKLLDPEIKTVYEERKKYDKSVNLVNQRLASYLDEKQVEAQNMFPHYFERYKTDGVEYNMYIGQSITKAERFDPIYLSNLRLWQLLVMCEMENEFRSLQEELLVPLEVASLILVYNTPISVHFRMDEKQFDVEGAYNARYEIIKKRVDKARIKGKKERITQPGHIAIIYSQEEDAVEYRKYLEFLASKGYLKNGFEDFELEDLQGVSGLKALRVEVSYEGKIAVDELIKEMESNPA